MIKPTSFPGHKAEHWCEKTATLHGFQLRDVEYSGIDATDAAHRLNAITSGEIFVDGIYILLSVRLLFERTGIAMRFQMKSIKSRMPDGKAEELVKLLELKPLTGCADQPSIMLSAVYEAVIENEYLPTPLSAVH